MTLPKRLRSLPLVRVCRPSGCRVHDNCQDAGKRPVVSTKRRESLSAARRWLEAGGNVGVSPRPGDNLLVLDVDHEAVIPLYGEVIGRETFTVRTGSGLFHIYLSVPDWGRENPAVRGPDGSLLEVIAGNQQTVAPPSVHPETGEPYVVFIDAPRAEVPAADVRSLIDRVGAELGDGDGDGDGGCAGQEPPDSDAPSPGEERNLHGGRKAGADLDRLDRLIDHDGYRADVREALEDPDAGHNQRQFAAGFLLDAVGLSVAETVRIIDKFNRWSNYDAEITERQVRSVKRSSRGGGRS